MTPLFPSRDPQRPTVHGTASVVGANAIGLDSPPGGSHGGRGSGLADPVGFAEGVARDASGASNGPGRIADFFELTKARLTAMVLVTTTVGFLLGEPADIRWGLLALTVIGTALTAASAMALNQALEVERDARMDRTKDRPLPASRMTVSAAIAIAGVLGIAGLVLLLQLVNPLASILAGANVLLYAFVYTPLKTRTSLNTIIGAITGGIPPMIGWVAATGRLDLGAWLLGVILFLWQLPHFLALAWMYREDYARGGFVMLPHIDPTGSLTSRVSILASLCLIPAALMTVMAGISGPLFASVAIILGLILAGLSLRLHRDPTERRARSLFLASLLYLPLLLGVMVIDHEWLGAPVPTSPGASAP